MANDIATILRNDDRVVTLFFFFVLLLLPSNFSPAPTFAVVVTDSSIISYSPSSVFVRLYRAVELKLTRLLFGNNKCTIVVRVCVGILFQNHKFDSTIKRIARVRDRCSIAFIILL